MSRIDTDKFFEDVYNMMFVGSIEKERWDKALRSQGLEIKNGMLTQIEDLSPAKLDSRTTTWTINDAENGDILNDGFGNIGIFKQREQNCWYSHIHLSTWNDALIENQSHFITYSLMLANEEERQKLFDRIKKEGMEWDPKKKELRKLSSVEQTGKKCDDPCITTQLRQIEKEIQLDEYERAFDRIAYNYINDTRSDYQFTRQKAEELLRAAKKKIAGELSLEVAQYGGLQQSRFYQGVIKAYDLIIQKLKGKGYE